MITREFLGKVVGNYCYTAMGPQHVSDLDDEIYKLINKDRDKLLTNMFVVFGEWSDANARNNVELYNKLNELKKEIHNDN